MNDTGKGERIRETYIQVVRKNKNEHLYRTRQLKNKSHCLMPHRPPIYDTSNMEEIEEEVIYSEEETMEGSPYPDNTWNSDDTMYEEDHSSRSEWT